MLSLAIAWAMVLVASSCAAGDGEDEYNAGAELHAEGDYVEAMRFEPSNPAS